MGGHEIAGSSLSNCMEFLPSNSLARDAGYVLERAFPVHFQALWSFRYTNFALVPHRTVCRWGIRQIQDRNSFLGDYESFFQRGDELPHLGDASSPFNIGLH
jgi:hypothetical protein